MDIWAVISGIVGAAMLVVAAACMLSMRRTHPKNIFGKIGLGVLWIWACLLASMGVRMLVRFLHAL